MNFDITSLLEGSSSKNLFDPAQLLAPLLPYIIGIFVVLGILVILYIMTVINTWRSQRAILEIRDILRDIHHSPTEQDQVTKR